MCWARDLNQGLTNRKLACCPLNLELRSEGVGGGGDDDDDHNHGDDKMYLCTPLACGFIPERSGP